MIRNQVAALCLIFSFFGVVSVKQSFVLRGLPAPLASGSLGPSRTGGIALDDRRGRRWIGRF
jgi:hypothetical protein